MLLMKRNAHFSSVDDMRLPELHIEVRQRSLHINGGGLSARNALGVGSPKSPSDSSHGEDTARAKRARTTASSIVVSISEDLICSISHELMVDPVCTLDGITYERKEIETWFQENDTSPETNLRLGAKTLIPNISVKKTIAKLLASGKLEKKVREDWEERKRGIDLVRAQKLFNEGKVEEAAELGHPEAQGNMAGRCHYGHHGQAQDDVKSLYWAKKAAAGGDRQGQFRLGWSYFHALGGLPENNALAVEWFTKAAEQGCHIAMNSIGFAYEGGGHGVTKNLKTAVSWFQRSAGQGDMAGQFYLGVCYYNGKGVAKSLEMARFWYQKLADHDYDGNTFRARAQRELGTMIMKGEGGEQDPAEAVSLWKKAAEKGDEQAQGHLDKLKTFSFEISNIENPPAPKNDTPLTLTCLFVILCAVLAGVFFEKKALEKKLDGAGHEPI
eukprot:CAMPEP_0171907692 /NCGR_PEP_ID=MMETSP0993-20121228/7177_1 /TAXON_ID=483369 /ORGANISM="non described non described, Strain CCMP2098" /LENGTH=441 /DNA_ID=CAMNT_0012540001 /DNA_START=20 /DNA_END=1346 /DNA_ORIENTATION=+